MSHQEEQIKLDAFYWHEALDRSYMLIDMIQDYLLDHPVFEQNEKLKEKVEQAQMLLSEVYQEIGSRED